MAETVGDGGDASAARNGSCQWLPENELRVYSYEYERPGFQGDCSGTRARTQGSMTAELQLLAPPHDRGAVDLHAGKSDWGTLQRPGISSAGAEALHPQLLGWTASERQRARAGIGVVATGATRAGSSRKELLLGFCQQ